MGAKQQPKQPQAASKDQTSRQAIADYNGVSHNWGRLAWLCSNL